MSSSENKALAEAIRLRVITRVAVDRGDFKAICEANDKADAAYLRLSPSEAYAYRQWALDGFDVQGFWRQVGEFLREIQLEIDGTLS